MGLRPERLSEKITGLDSLVIIGEIWSLRQGAIFSFSKESEHECSTYQARLPQ